MPPSSDDPDSTLNLIWKLHIPPKIQHFLWLVYPEKILNNMERTQKRIVDLACHHCPEDYEDLNYIKVYQSDAWIRVADVAERDTWISLPFKDWMRYNLKLKVHVNRVLVNKSFQKGVIPHGKKTSFLWVYILKPNYKFVHNLRKWEPLRAQEMG